MKRQDDAPFIRRFMPRKLRLCIRVDVIDVQNKRSTCRARLTLRKAIGEVEPFRLQLLRQYGVADEMAFLGPHQRLEHRRFDFITCCFIEVLRVRQLPNDARVRRLCHAFGRGKKRKCGEARAHKPYATPCKTVQ